MSKNMRTQAKSDRGSKRNAKLSEKTVNKLFLMVGMLAIISVTHPVYLLPGALMSAGYITFEEKVEKFFKLNKWVLSASALGAFVGGLPVFLASGLFAAYLTNTDSSKEKSSNSVGYWQGFKNRTYSALDWLFVEDEDKPNKTARSEQSKSKKASKRVAKKNTIITLPQNDTEEDSNDFSEQETDANNGNEDESVHEEISVTNQNERETLQESVSANNQDEDESPRRKKRINLCKQPLRAFSSLFSMFSRKKNTPPKNNEQIREAALNVSPRNNVVRFTSAATPTTARNDTPDSLAASVSLRPKQA